MATAPRLFPRDENCLPVRVCVAIEPGGANAQLAIMGAWLDAVCGSGGWAAAPAGLSGVVNDAIAFYFADQATARAFIGRFACGYRIPGKRH